MPRYVLEINEEQARVLRDALEIYSRIHLGQFAEVVEVFSTKLRTSYEKFHKARDLCMEARNLLTPDLPEKASYGIFSEEISDRARVAWDTMQVIRHRLAWERNPQGDIMVDFDTPLRSSQQPLPEFQRKTK